MPGAQWLFLEQDRHIFCSVAITGSTPAEFSPFVACSEISTYRQRSRESRVEQGDLRVRRLIDCILSVCGVRGLGKLPARRQGPTSLTGEQLLAGLYLGMNLDANDGLPAWPSRPGLGCRSK